MNWPSRKRPDRRRTCRSTACRSESRYRERIWSLDSPSEVVNCRVAPFWMLPEPASVGAGPDGSSGAFAQRHDDAGQHRLARDHDCRVWPPVFSISPPGVASQTRPAESSRASKTLIRASGSGGTNTLKRPVVHAHHAAPRARSAGRRCELRGSRRSRRSAGRRGWCRPAAGPPESSIRPLSWKPTQMRPSRSWKTVFGSSLGSPSLCRSGESMASRKRIKPLLEPTQRLPSRSSNRHRTRSPAVVVVGRRHKAVAVRAAPGPALVPAQRLPSRSIHNARTNASGSPCARSEAASLSRRGRARSGRCCRRPTNCRARSVTIAVTIWPFRVAAVPSPALSLPVRSFFTTAPETRHPQVVVVVLADDARRRHGQFVPRREIRELAVARTGSRYTPATIQSVPRMVLVQPVTASSGRPSFIV